MPFKFYIDNQLVDQPMNDMELTTTIRRDQATGGINITQDATLQWMNQNDLPSGVTSAYQYLKGLFDDSVCNEAGIVIYDEVSGTQTFKIYTGVIKITQIEIDEQRFFLKTKVQDNNFYAYINNNKSLAVNLAAAFTKNKLNLAVQSQYSLDLFNSNTCVYGSGIGALFHSYLLQDAFTTIVEAITDNLVTFQSDYLDSLTHQLFITKGQDLLNPYTMFPLAQVPTYEIAFEDLLTETDILRNVGYYIDASDPDNPVFRLEDSESLFSSVINVVLTDILFIRTFIDTSRLYGSVKVGSEGNVDGNAPWLTWEDATSYYGWKKEEFFPLGQCNTNVELNLVSRFQISNNVIQDTVIGQSTAFIDDYFFIQCDSVDTVGKTASAYQFPYFSSGGCFYNLGLNNYRKMQRHSNKFETAFGNFLGIGGLGFRALLGDAADDTIAYSTNPADPDYIPPGGTLNIIAPYVNETTGGGYDGSNNYNNITFEYVIPQDGDYSFLHRMRYGVVGLYPGVFVTVVNQIILYTAGMVPIDGVDIQVNRFSNGGYVHDLTFVVNAQAGEIVQASYSIIFDGTFTQPIYQYVNLNFDSFFECNGTPEGGITITTANDDLKKLRHEFEYSINETDWRAIVANPIGQIGFEKDGLTRYGWIEEMKHDHQTGKTQIKLITNNAFTT